jgi:hypothetical protein
MFGIGSTEFLIFFILAILVFSQRIEELFRSLCAACSEFDRERSIRAKLDRERGQPRFALRDLLTSAALIALGLAWVFTAWPSLGLSLAHLEPPVWYFVIGGAFIGAGVMLPFKLAMVGAMLGALVQLLLICTAQWFG